MEDKIIADLIDCYGITVNHIASVTGGLLNRKWRISTEKDDLLVKQYSLERFRKESIELIESRLQRQIILEENGVPCPFLWRCKDRVIRWLDDKTAYMVMDFCPGNTETSDTITLMQMRSLGSACAVIHKAFSQISVPSVRNLPVFGGYTMDLLWEYFCSGRTKCPPEASGEYLSLKAIHCIQL